MARILVIDDLRLFGSFATDYARSSHEGVAALKSIHAQRAQIDELRLDHDLGGTDDIRPVVRWIVEQCARDKARTISKIIIHTSNPAGAEMMELSLGVYYSTTRVHAAQFDVTVIDG